MLCTVDLQAILSEDATNAEISSQMNLLSTIDDARPTIRLKKVEFTMLV